MNSFNMAAVTPELALLIGAGAVLIGDLFVGNRERNVTYGGALFVLLVAAYEVWQSMAAGSVQYAFGGMFVVDPMTGVLKITAIVAAAFSLIYAQSYARDRDIWRGEFFALVLFALLGILCMISANNLLVIYLGLELQALALYALVALRRDDARGTEAAMKYFILGAMASGFLLYGMSMLYGATGTLDINAIAHRAAGGGVVSFALLLGTIFLIAGIAFKLGVVPFHMWVPDVYQGAPTPVALLLASAPKLGAFAMAFRLLVEGVPQLAVDWQHILAVLAIASIAIGNVTAVAQTNIKRMLGYSTVAQMGFMMLAMLAGVVSGNLNVTAGAYSAATFYVVTYALATAGAFGIVLLIAREGLEAEEIADLRGLARRSPWYAFLMSLVMFSLAGVPPTMGFYAKFVVLQALLSGTASGMVSLAVAAVLFSLVGAFYYIRVVKVMWFEEPTESHPIHARHDMRIALSLNGLLALILGILPQGLLALCDNAVLRALGS